MQYELYDCPKTIRTDLHAAQEQYQPSGLCLDPLSRYLYLETLAHSKTSHNEVLIRKMQQLRAKLPTRYHSYLGRAMAQLEGGQMEVR
jgi:NADPH-dependent 7-cyano-7-deazaguanine reductase QueF